MPQEIVPAKTKEKQAKKERKKKKDVQDPGLIPRYMEKLFIHSSQNKIKAHLKKLLLYGPKMELNISLWNSRGTMILAGIRICNLG